MAFMFLAEAAEASRSRSDRSPEYKEETMSHQFEKRLLAAALAVLWGTALQAADPAPAQPAAAEVAADPQAPTAAPAQAPTAAPAQPGAAADTQALETVVVTAR